MNTPFKFVAAFALTALCFGANAQDTKPAVKDSKMETTTETKMETKKDMGKGHKKAAKMAKKEKMTKETKM